MTTQYLKSKARVPSQDFCLSLDYAANQRQGFHSQTRDSLGCSAVFLQMFQVQAESGCLHFPSGAQGQFLLSIPYLTCMHRDQYLHNMQY